MSLVTSAIALPIHVACAAAEVEQEEVASGSAKVQTAHTALRVILGGCHRPRRVEQRRGLEVPGYMVFRIVREVADTGATAMSLLGGNDKRFRILTYGSNMRTQVQVSGYRTIMP